MIVVEAGFEGLAVADSVHDAPVEDSVVDRHNYRLFSPFPCQGAHLKDGGVIAAASAIRAAGVRARSHLLRG